MVNSDLLSSRIVAVFVVNSVIFGIQILSNRFFPELNKRHNTGLYLVLMPIGFGLYGWDLPVWSTAPLILGGVFILFVVFKRTIGEAQKSL